MPKSTKSIPVNILPTGTREGIVLMRMEFDGLPDDEVTGRSHRDNGYLFIVLEQGMMQLEIDFQLHTINAPSITYIHPNQVHRLVAFRQATTSNMIITAENIHPEYLKLLEEITPTNVLSLDAATLSVVAATASWCIALADRKEELLYDAILKQSCNTLIALIVSQFMARTKPADKYSRAEVITRSFKAALEQNYTTVKSPAAYAKTLNIAAPYLNECVNAVTGNSVSWQIQQRIVLEAKRLLYHSDRSVKEIAAELGYDDHSYFIRLFSKICGMTPTAFRSKNFE